MLCNLNILNLWLPEFDFLLNILLLFIFILYIKKLNTINLNTWLYNKKTLNTFQASHFYLKTNNYAYNFYSFLSCFLLFIFIFNRLFTLQTITSSSNLININFISNLNILLSTFFSAIIFFSYTNLNTTKPMYIEANLLILLALLGLDTLVVASNVILFYLSLELQNFCLICLCGIQLSNSYSIEAALKMYLLGSYSSSLIVLSCAGLCFQTGSFSWHNIFDYINFSLNNNTYDIFLWFFILNVGLLWKLAAAPLHLWFIDIITNIRMFITVFVTIVPKIAIFFFFINNISYFINIQSFNLLNIVIILSLVLGPLYAINQIELKSIIAYSSIGQTGFILISLFINKFYVLLLNVFLYLISLLFIWFCISLQKNYIYMTNYKNINNNLTNSFLLIILSLSLAGLPPLPTFYAKLFVIQTVLEANQFLFVFLSIISVSLSVFYSIKLLQYVIQPNKEFFLVQTTNNDNILCFVLTFIGSFLFSIFWYMQPINNLFIINYI